MQTFSQYAATRPLRSSSSGAVFGADTVVAGSIQTFAGVDVVTGMPVIVYTMQGQPPSIPEVYSDSIPTVLETGLQDQTGFVVVSSSPGYLPLRLGLSQVRLEWLTRISAKALSDAHTGGLVHGDLNPSHFFVQGDHLLLEGWGLAWQDTQPDFTPPEGSGTPAADVFAWARSMQAFGKGDPRKLLDGEMGRLIGHCLNPKPQERPTALELVIALEQVIIKKVVKPEVRPVQLNEVKPVQLPETQPEIQSDSNATDVQKAPEKVVTNAVLAVFEQPKTQSEETLQPLKLESLETQAPLLPIDEGIKIVAKTKAPERLPIEATPETLTKAPSELVPETETSTALVRETSSELATEIPSEPVIKTIAEPKSQPSVVSEANPAVVPEANPEKRFKKHAKTKTSSKPKIPILETPPESELREPENLAADEPDIVPSVRPEHEPIPLQVSDGSIEPGVVIYKDTQTSSNTIRVGFDEDDSWRSVKTYERPKRNPLILPVVIGLVVLLVIFGIVNLTRPKPTKAGTPIGTPSIGNPAQNSIVNFVMKTSGNQTARLTVISAPKEAKLVPGALLATIPGPVLFPYPGAYKVRVTMPNFAPGDVLVNVPQDTQIVIALRQP